MEDRDENDGTPIPDAAFEAALAEVLQRHGPAFKELADYDAGKTS